MTTNRGTSKCDCGHQFNLGSFRGQAVEFRQVGDYAPQMGCKLICPACGKVYFGWIRHEFSYWGDKSLQEFDQDTIRAPDGKVYPNEAKGKFAKRIECPGFLNGCGSTERIVHLGLNQIDTAYYETFRDEGEGVDTNDPSYLFAADTHYLTDWNH